MIMVKITDLIDFKNCVYNWDAIYAIPEFAKLDECEQSPKWHGEGNAWVHTKCVCNKAIEIVKNNELSQYDVMLLLTSALFHDIGKGVTTKQGKDGRWHSIGHEIEGEKLTRLLLWDEGYEFREAVCALVRWHMIPLDVLERKNPLETIAELSHNIPSWKLLIDLKLCDVNGSEPADESVKPNSLRRLFMLTNVAAGLNCLECPANASLKSSYDMKSYETKKKICWVVVPIGLPGAGKSTLYSSVTDSYEIISRDKIRAELGYCKEGEKVVCTSEQEEKVTKVFNERALKAAEDGKTIIFDNINLKKKYRDAYKNLLKDYRVFWSYTYVEAPSLSTNLKRREGQISEEVYRNMILNFDWPYRSEYDNFSINISNKTLV